MLEFKIIQELKPNTEILEIIKSYTYITKKGNLNKYGRMRLDYLKEHKKALYTELLMKDLLKEHLISVSKSSEDLLNTLMESYKKSDDRLSEKNKKSNHIEWAKLMNSYKNTAEEIILKEYIFA